MPLDLTPKTMPYYNIVDTTPATPIAQGALIYTAKLTSDGTNVPIQTILQNTINGTLTRQAQGVYRYTKTGAFTIAKFWATALGNDYSASIIQIDRVTDDYCDITTRQKDSPYTPIDDCLYYTSIEIRSYNN